MDIRCASQISGQEGGDPPSPRYRTSAAGGRLSPEAGP
jgi:hypothetical protein